MKSTNISKTPVFNAAQIAAAISVAPEGINGHVSRDETPVAGFWDKAKIRMPGKRGAQKAPVKVAVTVRFSPEVIAYFKDTGDGWQTRMNDALCEYVSMHKAG